MHSKSFDTRTAASVALSHIFTLSPLWKPSQSSGASSSADPPLPPPVFPNFSVEELVLQGKLLLASSGKEFTKPSRLLSSSAEVKKARKEAMGRLGLDFLDTDDMDLDKEFAGDDDVEMDEPPTGLVGEPGNSCKEDLKKEDTPPLTPSAPSPTVSNAPSLPDTDVVLSARERNRLKRKRKPGASAFVSAQSSQPTGAKHGTSPNGPPNK